MLAVEKITLNYEKTLSGCETSPVFGWVIASDRRDVAQHSWQLQLAEDEDFSALLYDSGVTRDARSNNITLPAREWADSTRYFARVRISDNHGEESGWSPLASWVSGLPAARWQGEFISAETPQDKDNSRGTLLRHVFALPPSEEIVSAVVHASALGLYQLWINGEKVGCDELAPGWTSYHHHLLYQTWDVSDRLCGGENVIGAMVGAGWYKGDMSFNRYRNYYGEQTGFICQLVVTLRDGSQRVIVSNACWQASDSAILFSEIYDGETYDARLAQQGWSEPGFAASGWRAVTLLSVSKDVLQPQTACPVQEIARLAPRALFTTPKGETVIDFGQNLSGWVAFRVRGAAGDSVKLRHFEVLDAEGNVYLANLRTAKQRIDYTLRGDEEERYHPHFTFQGFRYVQIECWPGTPTLADFSAVVLHSAMTPTGSMETSNADLNQLHHNILWGLKGNFVDIPTDCPQRDERLGWTGDAQIFCRTASYLMQTDTFFAKWLTDLQHDQTPEGGVPHVIPDILTGKCDNDRFLSHGRTHSAAAWADAAVINPWTLYLMYGDTQTLARQYGSMKAWVEFMRANAVDNIWSWKLQFGDWVALDAKEGSYFGATPNELTCMAYYALSTQLLSKSAKVLGFEDDAVEYLALHAAIVDCFHREFFTANGRLAARTQTAHILALYFQLVPQAHRERTVQTLLELLAEQDGHLVTGFVGTPYFCHALSENGQADAAWQLLLKEDFPSWLYQVKAGATTIWEHWDGVKPDGTMWSPDMNSFNHYAYGAIGEWLYRAAAGINTEEHAPGFKHSVLRPIPGGGLAWLKARYASVYGEIGVRWQQSGQTIALEVDIPPNTRSTLILDRARTLLETDDIDFTPMDGGYAAEVGSGHYRVVFQR
ncbi:MULTISPECIES: alpha-L-rhamnosidase [Enterobacteriaceae]|uniref:alpha-L-rhamnosidase n=1 Tax=Enterobacteriaceae TaxID=543 RepID=UPI0015DC0A72|nr:alpha-L-rhamnosidase [Klebsiella sp. WP8-S18-ESBL-06]BBT70636.1 alfa-L-rhamnosidase [Klebsiella sp. WP8-S18-ESBL-06]